MATRLLISDSNVLIDFDCCGLLESIFALPYEFAVPDILYLEELRGQHSDLPALGLSVRKFGPEVTADIQSLRARHKRPGFNDLMALALARSLDAELLTGDRHLREAAKIEGQACRGSIWLLEELVRSRVITVGQSLDALDAMEGVGRRLPWKDAKKRLSELK